MNSGTTPLLVAASASHTSVVKSLLDAGANPNARASGYLFRKKWDVAALSVAIRATYEG